MRREEKRREEKRREEKRREEKGREEKGKTREQKRREEKRSEEKRRARIYNSSNFEELQIQMILRTLETLFFAYSSSRFAVFTFFRRRLRAFFRNLHFYLHNSLFFDEDFHENQAKTSHSCSVASCDRFCVLWGPSGPPGSPLESLAMP